MNLQPEPIVYDDPLSVDRRLERIGLRREQVEQAVLISEYHRDQRTDNDAPGAQGWIAYTWCVRMIREILIPLGWERSNDQNRATVVSPDGKIAVSVVVGDEGTGRTEMIPDVQTPKGRATAQAVGQQSLFENLHFNVNEIYGPTDRQTWFLMRRRTDDAVFVEMSLPASMADGHVERWLERIVLGRYPYGSQFSIVEDFDSEPIEIPIRKRQ
jgi:hypothetical protein